MFINLFLDLSFKNVSDVCVSSFLFLFIWLDYLYQGSTQSGFYSSKGRNLNTELVFLDSVLGDLHPSSFSGLLAFDLHF